MLCPVSVHRVDSVSIPKVYSNVTKSIAQMCQKRPRAGSGPHDGPVLPVLNIKRLCQTCAKHMLKVCQTHVKRMSKGISKYVERIVKVCQKHEEHVP